MIVVIAIAATVHEEMRPQAGEQKAAEDQVVAGNMGTMLEYEQERGHA